MRSKHYLRTFLAFAFNSLLSFTAFSQSLVSIVPNVGTAGTTVSVTVTGSGVDFTSCTAMYVELQPTGGGTPFSSSLTGIVSPTQVTSDITIAAGAILGSYNGRTPYCITTWATGVFTVLAPGTTGTISGHVFIDENNNCVQDMGEDDETSRVIHVTPGDFYTITDASGDYSVDLVPGTYTLELVPAMYSDVTCPAAPITVTIGSVGDVSSGNDFAVEWDKVWDAGVYCSLNPVRPGFTQTHYITVKNEGLQPLTGTLKMMLDTHFTVLSTSPMGTVVADTIFWDIAAPILKGGMNVFTFEASIPASVPLGAFVSCTATMYTDSSDTNIANNVSQCSEIVIGSYDPNDKTVWDEEMNLADPHIDPSDSVLYYRVRFQNTGTASAINIFIEDTLDTKLDPATIQTVAVSHLPCHFTMNGNGNLMWDFPGINLPDSNTDEPGSHGFVMYRIKIKDGFSMGQNVLNTAFIYFDFNAPVVTNTTTTSIHVGMDEPPFHFEETYVALSPNPAGDILQVISGSPLRNIQVLNALGQEISDFRCDGEYSRTLSVSEWPRGICLVRVETDAGASVKKLLVRD